MSGPSAHPEVSNASLAPRRLWLAALWLSIVLVGIKAYYLGIPSVHSARDVVAFARSLSAISYLDVLFATVLWAMARLAIRAAGARARIVRSVVALFVVAAALSCAYALASVAVFGVFGGFLTYPLLALVGDVRMLSSSAATYFTPGVVSAIVAVPLAYVALATLTPRLTRAEHHRSRVRDAVVVASVGGWLLFGHYAFVAEWTTKQDRKIADNPQWVLLSSWWEAVSGENAVRMADLFPANDLADFAPLGMRQLPSTASVIRRITRPVRRRARAAPAPPPNVVLIVLESVAARWTSVSGGQYDTTPTLAAESARALVVDNFYAHIGRSSNSLGAMLYSTYPKLDFQDFTEEFPHPKGTSVVSVFRDSGYRTAFMMPSYLSWAGWDTFLPGAGFSEALDSNDFPCGPGLSSWGVEDRCMVDAMVDWIDKNRTRPFFLLGWTDQTHHPYEPTPGVPVLDLLRGEPVPDDYDLGRYLNVLHETDRQLARVFDTLRRDDLADNTIVVVVGDHGQAFGYPHNNYMQGSSVYEEDVHVPFMIWWPRLYPTPERSKTIAGHVDLAPTLAELAGLRPAPDWQGRSVFDTARSPRAYFYVAEDHFTLGVREGTWKYIYDLREGTEELYDLSKDAREWENVAQREPALAARLRQRLAAWTEANRRQYDAGP